MNRDKYSEPEMIVLKVKKEDIICNSTNMADNNFNNPFDEQSTEL